MSEKQNKQNQKKIKQAINMPAITRAMIKQHFELEDRVSYSHHGMKEARYRCLQCEVEGVRTTLCENANDFQWTIQDLAQHLQDYHDVYMGLDD